MFIKLNFLSIHLLIASILLFHSGSNAQRIKTTEKFICAINKTEMVSPTISISNNMRSIAIRTRQGKKQFTVINGVSGKAYDSVGFPVFSPDSKRFAYVAKNGATWYIVENGEERAIGNIKAILGLQFSPDKKNILYVADEGSTQYSVINGVKGNPYTMIDDNSIRFNPVNGEIAYSALKGNKHYMVNGGKESAPYDRVGFPIFSLQGDHLAFSAKNGDKEFAVIDSREGMKYDSIEAVIFSEDGKHYIFHAIKGNKQFVVKDGTEGQPFNFVHSLLISGEGSKVIYGVETETKNQEGFFHSVVINDKVMFTYETVVEGSLRMSNDNKHTAYEAEWHDEFFVVLDGDSGKHYGDVVQSTITFSPDGKRIAYAGENDSRRRINIDGSEGEGYDDIYSVVFTRNNKRVVYVAKAGDKEFVVVNAVKGNTYDAILGQGGVFFDSKNKFHYLAVRDNKVYLVEEKIK